MVNDCPHCRQVFTRNFCSNCGRPAELKRIDGRYIRDEISSVFNFDKGLLLTIKELFIRPGKSVRQFLTADRHRLVKPILFILITSLIYTLINNFFRIEERYVDYEGLEGTAPKIFGWVQQNYGYANILMGVFIALFLKLFFRKSNYNIYEILILLCFVMGMGMLILALFAFVQGISGLAVIETSGIVLMVYITVAIADFYNSKKFGGYLKVFFAYILGMLIFTVLAILFGVVIDLLLSLK